MIARKLIATAALAALLGPTAALAAQPTRPGPEDPRVRSVVYKARDVTQIYGHYGFTTSIKFSDTETIETISIGDSEAWQVVKPDQPNLVFVKPLEANGDTNMTVVTDKRIYNFMLFGRQAMSYQGRDLTFAVEFQYPDEVAATLAYQADQLARTQIAEADRKAELMVSQNAVAPEAWNFSYSYDGSEAIRPQRVFDDGKFTYFRFPNVTDTPAIFTVDASGNEALVNYNVKGDYIVVEELASQFTLRDGELATCIFNAALPSGQFDSLSPQRAERKRGGLFAKLGN